MWIMSLAFRECMLPPSTWSSFYHKPWNINIFLSTSCKVLPEFSFSFPSCKTLQNSWDRVHMGTGYHRHSSRCTRTNHRVLFRWCWTVYYSADTARPPSAFRCRLEWGIEGLLQRFRGITVLSLRGVEQCDSNSRHGAERRPSLQWTLSIHHYSGYGEDGILQWIGSMEHTEYYSGNRADGKLLWTWNIQIISWVLAD